jgi:hypothetical protein
VQKFRNCQAVWQTTLQEALSNVEVIIQELIDTAK